MVWSGVVAVVASVVHLGAAIVELVAARAARPAPTTVVVVVVFVPIWGPEAPPRT